MATRSMKLKLTECTDFDNLVDCVLAYEYSRIAYCPATRLFFLLHL